MRCRGCGLGMERNFCSKFKFMLVLKPRAKMSFFLNLQISSFFKRLLSSTVLTFWYLSWTSPICFFTGYYFWCFAMRAFFILVMSKRKLSKETLFAYGLKNFKTVFCIFAYFFIFPLTGSTFLTLIISHNNKWESHKELKRILSFSSPN